MAVPQIIAATATHSIDDALRTPLNEAEAALQLYTTARDMLEGPPPNTPGQTTAGGTSYGIVYRSAPYTTNDPVMHINPNTPHGTSTQDASNVTDKVLQAVVDDPQFASATAADKEEIISKVLRFLSAVARIGWNNNQFAFDRYIYVKRSLFVQFVDMKPGATDDPMRLYPDAFVRVIYPAGNPATPTTVAVNTSNLVNLSNITTTPANSYAYFIPRESGEAVTIQFTRWDPPDNIAGTADFSASLLTQTPSSSMIANADHVALGRTHLHFMKTSTGGVVSVWDVGAYGSTPYDFAAAAATSASASGDPFVTCLLK